MSRPLVIIPDASLGDMLQSAEAVVLARVNKRLGVRIVDRRPALEQENDVILPEPLPVLFTEYEVTLTEVLKPYSEVALGPVIRVASRGGVGNFNGVTIDENTRTPQLIEGRQYVLFLTFAKSINEMLFGAFGVFDLTSPTVSATELIRETSFGKELIGLASQHALRNIRAMLADPLR